MRSVSTEIEPKPSAERTIRSVAIPIVACELFTGGNVVFFFDSARMPRFVQAWSLAPSSMRGITHSEQGTSNESETHDGWIGCFNAIERTVTGQSSATSADSADC